MEYIAIHCYVNVVNDLSLHHKNDWTSSNLDYTLQFIMIYMVIQGVHFFFVTKPIFPYEISFYHNPVTYCNIAIYCNTLTHNTQYGLDLYCLTPNLCAKPQSRVAGLMVSAHICMVSLEGGSGGL